MCEYVEDPLMLVKLSFFVCIAKLFQTDKPIMPYISDELQVILTILLSRFIKTICIRYSQYIVNVVFNKKENIISQDKVDAEFSAMQMVDDVEKSKKKNK